MTPLRDLPVRRKLVLILMLSTGVALLIANFALVGLDLLLFRRDLVRDLETLAAVVAENSTAALTFNDAKAAGETLAALRGRPAVAAAALYDAAGRPFARYLKAGGRGSVPPAAPAPGHRFTAGALVLSAPVELGKSRLGSLYVETDLEDLYGRLRLQAAMVSAILLLAAGVSYLLFARLQRLISEPILDLAATARAVSEREDFSLRAKKRSADELGQLVDGFNRMLAGIERRDADLQQAKEELEERVEKRTRELERELAERRRTERQLAERNALLDESNRELDDFAYIASHDLKEPLRGIHNFSLFLLEDYGEKLDAEGRAKLETLPRLTRRMEALIDSLLQFSRVGRVDLAIDRVDLNEIVAAVLESLSIAIAEARTEIAIPRHLPSVRCDRARVGEIFHNLIANAVKYNDKPGKRIEIGYQDGADETLAGQRRPPVFYVRDNGIGIPAKHFDAVFRIFKRLHGRDQYGGGTGAGLTIVKKIVERHHGRVWLESAAAEGTTFYFTLQRGA